MTRDVIEQRRHPRVVFSPDDGLVLNFSLLSNPSRLVRATVLNLSRSGVGLALESSVTQNFRKGMRICAVRFALRDAEDRDSFCFPQDLETRVRWVVEGDPMDYLGMGCEFVNATSEFEEGLVRYVQAAFPDRTL